MGRNAFPAETLFQSNHFAPKFVSNEQFFSRTKIQSINVSVEKAFGRKSFNQIVFHQKCCLANKFSTAKLSAEKNSFGGKFRHPYCRRRKQWGGPGGWSPPRSIRTPDFGYRIFPPITTPSLINFSQIHEENFIAVHKSNAVNDSMPWRVGPASYPKE